MTVEEFHMWQGFLRQFPRGLRWDNWAHGRLASAINRLLPRLPNAKLPKLDKFIWHPPEPLFVETERKKVLARNKGKKR